MKRRGERRGEKREEKRRGLEGREERERGSKIKHPLKARQLYIPAIPTTYLGCARDMPSKILGHSGRPKWVLAWRPVIASLSSPSRSMMAKAWLSRHPRVR